VDRASIVDPVGASATSGRADGADGLFTSRVHCLKTRDLRGTSLQVLASARLHFQDFGEADDANRLPLNECPYPDRNTA
jgi:hypothetical protein